MMERLLRVLIVAAPIVLLVSVAAFSVMVNHGLLPGFTVRSMERDGYREITTTVEAQAFWARAVPYVVAGGLLGTIALGWCLFKLPR